MLRGRCRRCGIAISSQYMIVEALTGVLFAAIYLAFYVPGSSTPWWNEVGGPWWTFMGPGLSSPAFATLLILLAGLIAMTAIDARTFTIPIQSPVIVTLLAFTGWGVRGLACPTKGIRTLANPRSRPTGNRYGGSRKRRAGLELPPAEIRCLPIQLRRLQRLSPQSAAQTPLKTDETTPFELFFAIPVIAGVLTLGSGRDLGRRRSRIRGVPFTGRVCKPSTIAEGAGHAGFGCRPRPGLPHARREMLVELLYLAPCLAGACLGWFLCQDAGGDQPSQFVQAITASLAGYLIGGGVVWTIRILGTLAFGREAMGIGDVHMLAAVGAVLGWEDPIWIFFLACGVAPWAGRRWRPLGENSSADMPGRCPSAPTWLWPR